LITQNNALNSYFQNLYSKKNNNLSIETNLTLVNFNLSNKLFNYNLKNQTESNSLFFYNIILNNGNNNKNSFFNINYYSDFIESSRYIKKQQGILLPIRLIKLDQKFSTQLNNESTLFRFRFNSGNSNIQSKNVPNTTYMTIKQKRYERKKSINSVTKFLKDQNGNLTKKIKYSSKTILLNNSIFEDYINDATSYYRMLKKNKKRSELISVNLSRRIIRTKRTLVLPAHTNITLITNSFDIVHS